MEYEYQNLVETVLKSKSKDPYAERLAPGVSLQQFQQQHGVIIESEFRKIVGGNSFTVGPYILNCCVIMNEVAYAFEIKRSKAGTNPDHQRGIDLRAEDLRGMMPDTLKDLGVKKVTVFNVNYLAKSKGTPNRITIEYAEEILKKEIRKPIEKKTDEFIDNLNSQYWARKESEDSK